MDIVNLKNSKLYSDRSIFHLNNGTDLNYAALLICILSKKEISVSDSLQIMNICSNQDKNVLYKSRTKADKVKTKKKVAKEFTELRNKGMTYRQIAELYNMSTGSVYSILCDYGTIVPREAKLKGEDLEKAKELRKQGFSFYAISKKMGGYTYTNVRHAILKDEKLKKVKE